MTILSKFWTNETFFFFFGEKENRCKFRNKKKMKKKAGKVKGVVLLSTLQVSLALKIEKKNVIRRRSIFYKGEPIQHIRGVLFKNQIWIIVYYIASISQDCK